MRPLIWLGLLVCPFSVTIILHGTTESVALGAPSVLVSRIWTPALQRRRQSSAPHSFDDSIARFQALILPTVD